MVNKRKPSMDDEGEGESTNPQDPRFSEDEHVLIKESEEEVCRIAKRVFGNISFRHNKPIKTKRVIK